MLADLKLPSPLLISLIQLYSKLYAVKLNEIKASSLTEFKTFNDFFTRQLNPKSRPIDNDPDSVISPVDGKIAEFGDITNSLMIQTKGVYYSLIDLVGTKHAKLFKDGFFLTLYLSPSDYHRIHSPISGRVTEFSYFSGNLWPVNELGVKRIGGLFSINERIVTAVEGKSSSIGMVKVGATVVGKIKVDYSDLSSTVEKRHNCTFLYSQPDYTRREMRWGDFSLAVLSFYCLKKVAFSLLI
jgi:phosphatidylserine decarboxylase